MEAVLVMRDSTYSKGGKWEEFQTWNRSNDKIYDNDKKDKRSPPSLGWNRLVHVS